MNLYARANAAADRLEDRIAKLPGMAWFHFNTTGHPISWLQHTLFALAFTAPFALFGYAKLGAGIAFGVYVARELVGGWLAYRKLGLWPAAFVYTQPRESYQRGFYVGWLVDGTLDVVGPGVLWLLL